MPSVSSPTDIQSKLARVQPRVDTGNNQDDRHHDRPQLDVEHIDIEAGKNGTDNRGQNQGKEQVAACTVVLPHSLGVVHATKHAGDAPHEEADQVLRDQDQARHDAQVAMDAVEVRAGTLLELVGLNEQPAGGKAEKAEQIERGVEAGARLLFLGGPGGLQDENGLGEGQDAGGLQERVRAKEGDQGRVGEDGGPDERDEEDGAELREPGSSCGRVLSARSEEKEREEEREAYR